MAQHYVGELDQRIELQSQTRTPDGVGGASKSWSTYATVWAKIRPLTGRERENAERNEAKSDYLVVIRYRDDVREKHRAKWGTRYLNIRFVRDAGGRSTWLEIEAEKGATS